MQSIALSIDRDLSLFVFLDKSAPNDASRATSGGGWQAQQHVSKLEQQLQHAEDAALASQIAAKAEAAAAVERFQTQCAIIREAATAEGLASGNILKPKLFAVTPQAEMLRAGFGGFEFGNPGYRTRPCMLRSRLPPEGSDMFRALLSDSICSFAFNGTESTYANK